MVQWFSFVAPSSQDAPRRRSPSPSVDASSPSHVSNSIESSGCESPPLVPSTVTEGDASRAGGSSADGSVDSGRATKREGSVVWRLPDGSWHPRNIYSDTDDSRGNDVFDSVDSARLA